MPLILLTKDETGAESDYILNTDWIVLVKQGRQWHVGDPPTPLIIKLAIPVSPLSTVGNVNPHDRGRQMDVIGFQDCPNPPAVMAKIMAAV